MTTPTKVVIVAAAAVAGYFLYQRFKGGGDKSGDGNVSITNYAVTNGVCFKVQKLTDGTFRSTPVGMDLCCADVPDLPECGGPVTQPD